MDAQVLTMADCGSAQVTALLRRFGLRATPVHAGRRVPNSYWGDREAGLDGGRLFYREDTPVHSVLHEAAHFVCMDAPRRSALSRDAGGDFAEENAVCYLQILLADHVDGFGRARMMRDMDAWGYSFRLGGAQAWFEQEAEDACQWLQRAGLIDAEQRPTWRVRLT